MYAQNAHNFATYYGAPLYQKHHFENTPFSHIRKKMAQCKGQENIDAAAVEYYLSNHALHLLQAEYGNEKTLPAPVWSALEQQKERLNDLAQRMFFYLVTICEEEARFGTPRNNAFFEFIESSVSPKAATYASSILRAGHSYDKKNDKETDLTCFEALKTIEMIFRFAQWSPGFGGLAWAQITQVGIELVEGQNSWDLMVDKAFSLSHNNGAIFNKGHVFSMYSRDFYTLLDIQASGQIPQAIHSKQPIAAFKNPQVVQCYERFLPFCSANFTLPYDPKQVASTEKVRAAKQKAQQQQNAAYYAKHSGGSSHQQATPKNTPNGPPPRACDALLSLEEYENLRETSVIKKSWNAPKR